MKKILLFGLLTSSLMAKEIKEIKFDGLNQISSMVAYDFLNFNVGDEINIKKIDNSINKFYSQGYFKDIYVMEENNILTYYFKENPIIAKIEVLGYLEGEDNQEQLKAILQIKKGDVYNSRKLEDVKNRILAQINAEGFFESIVEISEEKINDTSIAITFNVNKGENIIIDKIKYSGAKLLNKSDFEVVSANKEVDNLGWLWGRNDGKLQLNDLVYDSARIQDLYRQKGYLDTKVSHPYLEVDFNQFKGTLLYKIEEGEQYKINDIVINNLDEDLLDIKQLKSELNIQVDDTFNILNMRKDIKIIKLKIANLGYAFVKITPNFELNKDDLTTSVSYTIDIGDKVYINDVIISGNTRTLDKVIRREVFLAPDDLYNYKDFIDTKNALKRTGYFDTVTVTEKKISKDKIDILVEITEAATGNIMVGGGYGSYGGMLLNAAISDKNIFGSGIDIGLNLDYSSTYAKFNASFHNPRLYDTQYSMGVNLYNSEYESYDYTDNRKGGSIVVGKNFTRFLNGSTSYQYVNSELSDINSTTIYYESGASVKSSFTPSISFNNSDDYYTPRNGMLASSSLEIAGVGGDQEFIKSYNTFSAYKGVQDYLDYDLIFRYKARAGYIQENGYLPVNEKFYIGGIKTVRGYESGSLSPVNKDNLLVGGKMTFSNSIEASIPLIESAKMRLTFFYDYGMIGEDNFDDIARSGTGVAIEWMAPIGPVNLIFAKALDSEEGDRTSTFEFTLGTRF